MESVKIPGSYDDDPLGKTPGEENKNEISEKYEIPPPEPSTSFTALKERIWRHYELASDYYYSLW